MRSLAQEEEGTAPLRRSLDLSRPDNSELNRGCSFAVEVAWHFIGGPLVRSQLLPISRLKVLTLRLFGARIGRGVYIKPRVRVKFPWYLEIGEHCWLGEGLWIDNLSTVRIGSHVCISQDAYLCTGNHDWTHPNLKLFHRPIVLQDGCWVSARSMICPGTTIGECAVVLGGSVVRSDVPPYEIHGGNPATYIKRREIAEPDAPLAKVPGTVL